VETPDVTKAQLLALAQGTLATLGAFGFQLTAGQQTKVMLLSGVVATIIVAADVAIRRGRQKHLHGGIDVPALLAQLASLDAAPAGVRAPSDVAARARELAAAEEAATRENGPQPPPGAAVEAPVAAEPLHGPTF